MNLGKLLGVGKSFFGSDPLAAYRLNKRLVLPRFNEGKNPFAPKKDGNPAEGQAAAPKAEAAVPAPAPEVSKVEKAPPPYAFKPAIKPAAKPLAPPAAQVPAVTKSPRPGWTTRLNPFRGPEPAPQPVTVQAELSLDAVKVVHNDLADADVEVVPAKSRAGAAPVLPAPRQAWEYMGEKLLNPG